MLQRIRPSSVKEAYVKTGLIPITGNIYRDEGSCALGALFAVEKGVGILKTTPDKEVVEYFYTRYGMEYTRGFWFGFDNFNHPIHSSHDWEERIGHEDGRATGCEIFRKAAVG
jgi:hypothetical protein